MSAVAGPKWDQAEDVFRRDGWTCQGPCGRWFGDRPEWLQVDHIVERADGGRSEPANLETLCRDCHRSKTGRSRAARRPGFRGRSRSWRDPWRFPVAVSLIVAADWWPYCRWWLPQVTAVGVLVWVGSVAWFVWGRRRSWMRHQVAVLTRGLAREHARSPRERVVKVKSWEGRFRWPQPTNFTVKPSEQAALTDPGLLDRVAAKASKIIGREVTARWEGALIRCVLATTRPRLAGGAPEPGPDPLERVKASARKVIGGEVTVTAVVHDGEGLEKFRIGYPADFDDSDDGNRTELLDRVNAKLDPVRYAAVWDTGHDALDLTRRPPMPKRVDRPAKPDDPWHIDLGVDEHGRAVEWDLRVAPHILVAGPTRSGKTACIRSIITGASLRRFDIYGCDPKRVELAGFAGWPGVEDIADTPDTMIAMVERIEALMMARYDQVKADPACEAALTPILFIIDEFAVFQNLANLAWTRSGMHPVIGRVHNIVVLGGRCRLHVVIGTQQPSAAALGKSTAIREQMGCRIGCGPLDPQSSGFLFKSQAVGRDLPRKARGRATVDSDDDPPREVQLYWTPDPSLPDDVQTGDDLALLEQLREGAAP